MNHPSFHELLRSFTSRVSAFVATASVALVAAGCGTWEEAEYPEAYVIEQQPISSEELALQQAQAQSGVAQPEYLVVEGDEYADADPSALTEFRPALEGHGTWISDPTYGTVWVPSVAEVGPDFQPYVTAGHWTYADDTSWVWVSDYDWGWAPFHYGRWVYLPGHGWSWIPGRKYAGAWVTWRTAPGYGYVGWAPMAPSWYWYGGYARGWHFGYYGHSHYAYCHTNYLYDPYVHRHVVVGADARGHHAATSDYVPARPGVGPRVGSDRVVANPSVHGTTSAGAEQLSTLSAPTRGGRTVGPRPAELGVNQALVIPPPKTNVGLARAQTLGSVSTAVRAGAAAPKYVRPASSFAPSSSYPGAARVAGSSPAAASRWTSPSASRWGRTTPSSSFSSRSSAPSFRSSSPFGSSSASTFRSSPSFGSSSASSFRSSPSFGSSSAGSFRSSPSFSSGGGSSFRSSPSFGGGSSFRSSPSFGGGGGGGGGFRSSPSSVGGSSFRRR